MSSLTPDWPALARSTRHGTNCGNERSTSKVPRTMEGPLTMTDDLDDAVDRRVFLAAIGASAALAANTGAASAQGATYVGHAAAASQGTV